MAIRLDSSGLFDAQFELKTSMVSTQLDSSLAGATSNDRPLRNLASLQLDRYPISLMIIPDGAVHDHRYLDDMKPFDITC